MPTVESAAVANRDLLDAQLIDIPNLQSRLQASPDEPSQTEKKILSLTVRAGDRVVYGRPSVAGPDPCLPAKQDGFRRHFSHALDREPDRRVQLRLPGGLAFSTHEIYCQPRRITKGATKQSPGVHWDVALVGVVDRVTPYLRRRVASQTCQRPALESARGTLERRCVSLDVKALRSVSYQCGEKNSRTRKLEIDTREYCRGGTS